MQRILYKPLVLSSFIASSLIAAALLFVAADVESTSCWGTTCSRDAFGRARPEDKLALLEEALRNAWQAASRREHAGSVGAVDGELPVLPWRVLGTYQVNTSPAGNELWPPPYPWDIGSRLGTSLPAMEKGRPLPAIADPLDQGVSIRSDFAGNPIGVDGRVSDAAGRLPSSVPASRSVMMLLAALGIIGLMIRRRSSAGFGGALR